MIQIGSGKIAPTVLKACVPYECRQGRFLQLPFTSCFAETLVNPSGTDFYFSPGYEQGGAPKYDFLVHAVSALVSQPSTYGRIQWPDGRYLSTVPVDLWSMVATGRNGRLLAKPKFIPRGSVIRIDLGTAQVTPVDIQIFFEGCILIPE
jgi:hypothetical protein